ncbi:glutamine--fructose-6-phosphate transaminase (isomerizing) [Candidatus Woesearchaeota archaeon]|nr:glutamine--fructose-6-phosphate transaminase (isomerizing) [Candidatus Woesearchaeota archaeon]
MCGIVGIAAKKEFSSSFLLERLKRLEYRGYDSYGYYDTKNLEKFVGEVVVTGDNHTKLGVAHTRWATHGGVTVENAHPHVSCDGRIIIVHNGIIENFAELKKELIIQGHRFSSQTDSEVIAHYFESKLKHKDIKQVMVEFFRQAQGTFAVLVMIKGDEKLYALKKDSPMVLGLCKGMNMLASDIYAFSDLTDKAVFFENNEFAIITESSWKFFDKNGKAINKSIKKIEWENEEKERAKKKDYKHFMLKEIEDEPGVVKRMLFSMDNEQKQVFNKVIKLIKSSKKIVFAACGTSYHASLLGAYYLHQVGVEAQTLIASEFKHYANIDKDTLVIAISQSGETMDVIDALKYAQEKKARIISIVNVLYSSIQRMSELSINILAGQERAVPSTKAFVNQATLLLRICQELGYKVNLSNLADKIKALLEQKEDIKKLAEQIAESKDAYIIGRGLTYPVAREIALKIKETAYIHAEGMMGGELKHGTIALIEEGTPVISLVNINDPDIISNTKEVEARGAGVIMITNNPALRKEKNTVYIHTDNDGKFGILAAIAGQLITYYAADYLGRPIDKPRNLAKSVTVK